MKHYMSVFLCVSVILLFAMPFGCADENSSVSTAAEVLNGTVISSGDCGYSDEDSVEWTVDSNGTLTISGSGRMDSVILCPPWEDELGFITTVVIGAGITEIQSGEFAYCDNLKAINVDSNNTKYCSVNGVLYNKNCTTLVACPAGMEGSFTVPESVKRIQNLAFKTCGNLQSITIPKSVTSGVDWRSFVECWKLKTINVDSGNTEYASQGGVLYSKDHTELLYCPQGMEGDFRIPDSVTSIDEYAFSDCGRLESITVPDGVTTIEQGVFSSCDSLKSIVLPEHLTDIGAYAFSGCECLKSINIPDTVEIIGESAFDGCSALTEITLPDGITVIDGYTFWGCSSLERIIIPDSVLRIKSLAFAECTSLTEVRIPAGVRSIVEYAFAGSDNVTLYVESGSYAEQYAKDQGLNYAIYDLSITYTVNYNANGGSGIPSSQTKEHNIALTLSESEPSKTYLIHYNSNGGSVYPASKSVACAFVNWNSAANGTGTSYEPGGEYTANEDVTLYAQWITPAAGALATPVRTGYTFDGWYTAATGGKQFNASSTVTGNMTVYAHWTELNSEIDPEFGDPEFTLPIALKEIKESAFENIKATVIYVPDTCVSIGAYAFRNAKVEQIRIPAGCSIADTAFECCRSVMIFGKAGSPAEMFCKSHDNCTFIKE